MSNCALSERIHLEISPDELTATVTFNLTPDELALQAREKLRKETIELLDNNKVVYGICSGVFNQAIMPGQTVIIATGTPAVSGTDASVTMYELMEAKPEVGKDGKVDFYDMKLINRVKPGDWLGERVEATDGTPGRTVKGIEIKASRGRSAVLNYDRSSVAEVSADGKTLLLSRLSGAVNYSNGRISVSNHLEIDGDVGISTGNIKFDGYLTIKGTILDGFSVEAAKDIEVNGLYGLGNIKSLVSTGGSIYIKGGVSARDRVEIRAAKNIYVKFADNTNIICGETAHIGYYSLNSNINARDVVFDSSSGQIIGGYVRAEIHISVPICGTEMERRTAVEVTGFNRQALVSRLDEVFHEIGMKKEEQQKLKQLTGDIPDHFSAAQAVSEKIYILREEIRSLEEERKLIAVYLKTKGDGEIAVTRRLYPNCSVILGGMHAQIPPDDIISTFYLKDGEIKAI